MKRSAILFLLALTALFSSASTTIIEGKVDKFYLGHEVLVYTFEECLSNELKLAAKAKIEADGSFRVSVPCEKTQRAILNIKRVNGVIYLAPNTTYNITFPALSSGVPYSFNNTCSVNLVINKAGGNDINLLQTEFNNALETFVSEKIEDILTPNFKTELDVFRKKWEGKAKELNNEYFFSTVHFSVANIARNIPGSRKELYTRYLKDAPIDISNIECAAFIQEFFKGVVEEFDIYAKDHSLKKAINQNEPFSVYLSKLSSNDFLEDKILLNIVSVYGLSQVYSVPGYSKPNVLALLKQASRFKLNESVKILAKNSISKLTKLNGGFVMPDFSLNSVGGENLNSASLKGKPTVLFCWATWSRSSLLELKNLEILKDKFGDKVNFVALNLDFELSNDIVKRYNPSRNIKHYNYKQAPDILEELGITTAPQVILFDKTGKFTKQPAPLPGSGLEQVLKPMFN
jgi:thiol-disulfide isomerase/thioredoxin